MTTTAPPPDTDDPPVDPDTEVAEILAQIGTYTGQIREHQDIADTASTERKRLVRRLRTDPPGGNPVTFARIAEAMGTTEASVYKLVRGIKSDTPPPAADQDIPHP